MIRWNDLLPKSILIGDVQYEIRSDYRAILDICTALSDAELSEQERAVAALGIFYPDFEDMPQDCYNDALKLMYWFINCGDDEKKNRTAPKLVDWEQDFRYIVAPINRVTGQEIRAVEYMHWWTFIAAYYEIGDCLFAQIVRIRERKASGKALDKQDREWYAKNRELVDMKTQYTESDDSTMDLWTGKKKTAPE
ncbi:MAG: hypothetical protein GXW99_00205 [Clostridiales bacterium]|nr:hypothetical protein [Clostridiales bacterium]